MSLTSRLKRVEQRVRVASARYEENPARLAGRLFSLYRRQGFRPFEALKLGLVDPQNTARALAGCIPKKELMGLQNRLNPPELACLTEDKSVFYPLCDALGLRVPRTFAAYSREGGWTLGGGPTHGLDAWKRYLRETAPDAWVMKPADGVYGSGVHAIRRTHDGFVDHRGHHLSADALLALMHREAGHSRLVLQERLVNHPDLVRLTGAEGLQTVRISTLVTASGEVVVLYAEWKIIVGDSVIDNFKGGETGNLLANISAQTGALADALAFSHDGVGMAALPTHPTTGLRFRDFTLPYWTELLALAQRGAQLFLPSHTLGWDIAITPTGPVVVEANRWWDPANEVALGPLPEGVAEHDLVHGLRRLREEASRFAAPPPTPAFNVRT